MKRSHSKRTYRAGKGIPKEILESVDINGKVYPTPEQRKMAKKEHNRRSRNFLKKSLKWELENEP